MIPDYGNSHHHLSLSIIVVVVVFVFIIIICSEFLWLFSVDTAKVTAALDEALKADDSPLSHGFAFFAASYLKGDLVKYYDLIEDVIAQADEVDEKYLQVGSTTEMKW